MSLVLLASNLLGLQALQAYELLLKPTSIHDAYVLGRRNDQATANFLAPYIWGGCSPAEASCFITQIELLTPFAQIVDLSQRNATTNYTEEQAADDYRRRSNTVVVQIVLVFPAAYAQAAQKKLQQNPAPKDEDAALLRPENFWQNFRFALKQHDKVIPTKSIRHQPVYSAATKEIPSVLDGANVWLEYDAQDVASDVAAVEVLTPEPKTITATFDLKKLR